MSEAWFRPRGYKHLDVPVGESFASRVSPGFVESHSWSPLIRYEKREKRYKRKEHKTVFKNRPIMYASHRDACILSKYAYVLSGLLDDWYISNDLDSDVIAYRKLGKANYNFAANAHRFAIANAPCTAMCFDVTGFYDNLDHLILKNSLKKILNVSELPKDWLVVFRQVTKFRSVNRTDLEAHPVFGPRLSSDEPSPVATIGEIKQENIYIHQNSNKFGIPQGTPISACMSNLYMMTFDLRLHELSQLHNALYQRYSDDILLLCRPQDVSQLHTAIADALSSLKLSLKDEKTDIVPLVEGTSSAFQYLGFQMSLSGASIRPSSMSRQWRRLRRGIRRTREAGEKAKKDGHATKVFTKKLRRRFLPQGCKNFSSYAERAGHAFETDSFRKQLGHFKAFAERAINGLNK